MLPSDRLAEEPVTKRIGDGREGLTGAWVRVIARRGKENDCRRYKTGAFCYSRVYEIGRTNSKGLSISLKRGRFWSLSEMVIAAEPLPQLIPRFGSFHAIPPSRFEAYSSSTM